MDVPAWPSLTEVDTVDKQKRSREGLELLLAQLGAGDMPGFDARCVIEPDATSEPGVNPANRQSGHG